MAGKYQAILNSDAAEFGGGDRGDKGLIDSESIPCHGQEQSISIDLPPMSGMIYRCARKKPVRKAGQTSKTKGTKAKKA